MKQHADDLAPTLSERPPEQNHTQGPYPPDRITLNGVEYVRPGVEAAPDCVSIHGMYDMHLFHPIKGATVDEVIENWRQHNRELQPAMVGGHKVDDLGPSNLCPAIVLRGDKELRRVGQMIFPRDTANDRAGCDEDKLRAWRDALLADPDIPRLLRATAAEHSAGSNDSIEAKSTESGPSAEKGEKG